MHFIAHWKSTKKHRHKWHSFVFLSFILDQIDGKFELVFFSLVSNVMICFDWSSKLSNLHLMQDVSLKTYACWNRCVSSANAITIWIHWFKDKSGSHKSLRKKSRILSANYSSVWHWQCYCHSANKGFAFQFIVNRSKNYDEIPRCQYNLLLPHWTVWQSCQWELFDIYWKTFWSHFFPLPNRILVPEILPCIFYAFFPEIEIILPS